MKEETTTKTTTEEFYNDGRIKSIKYEMNGKCHRLDGPACISYFWNGDIKHEWYYIDGEEICEWYHDDDEIDLTEYKWLADKFRYGIK